MQQLLVGHVMANGNLRTYFYTCNSEISMQQCQLFNFQFLYISSLHEYSIRTRSQIKLYTDMSPSCSSSIPVPNSRLCMHYGYCNVIVMCVV